MTEQKTYNGWTNYETFAVALWIDNEQGSYNEWRERCQFALDAADGDNLDDRRENAAQTVAQHLKDEIEEGNPLSDKASLYSDLLQAAISETNWYEIAKNWLDDMEPTEEASDDE